MQSYLQDSNLRRGFYPQRSCSPLPSTARLQDSLILNSTANFYRRIRENFSSLLPCCFTLNTTAVLRPQPFSHSVTANLVGLIGFEPIKAQPTVLQTVENLQLLSKPIILVLAKGVEPLMLTRKRRDLQSRAIATLPNQHIGFSPIARTNDPIQHTSQGSVRSYNKNKSVTFR